MGLIEFIHLSLSYQKKALVFESFSLDKLSVSMHMLMVMALKRRMVFKESGSPFSKTSSDNGRSSFSS